MKLPDGWFNDKDIEIYRTLAIQIPVGGKMAELGVWKGRSLCSIADILKERDVDVIAVDTFEGSKDERVAHLHDEALTLNIQEIFENNISNYGIYPITIKGTTTDAAQMFTDESFDLVFIDTEHTPESARDDIKNWLPKIKFGGIISGHDWNWTDDFNQAIREEIASCQFNEAEFISMGIWWARKI